MSSAVYFLLDRSGSMFEYANDTIGGFNSFAARQKIDNPEGTMSLFVFSDDFKPVFSNTKMKNVETLTAESYFPYGPTALLDSMHDIIKIAAAEERTQENKIIVVILTDGEENGSKRHTKTEVNELIRAKTESGEGRWSFVFLGANQDAIKEASKYGISHNCAMTFSQENTTEAFESLSMAVGRQTSRVRDGAVEDSAAEQIEFTQLEREASQSIDFPPNCPFY